MQNQDTHSKVIGYLLWIFGFMGAHRFYYGRQITGTIWFFTLGLLFIGWIIDLFLIPAITLYALVEVLLAAFTMLALSSLSSSARYTAMLYAGAVLFTDALFTTLRAITGNSALAWLSFRANLGQIGDVIFRLEPRFDSPWLLSVVVVVASIGLSVFVLERRVRGVEVVT